MLLHPQSLQLAPLAQQVLAGLPRDGRFKLELPSSQLEILTPPMSTVPEAAGRLMAARSELARCAEGLARPAGAGVHPFSPGSGQLNELPRYRHTLTEYGPLAHRQLVCAFQVHVSVGSAELALAVYNAARAYLPLLAALAANGPFYEGRDTGLASVRPLLCQLLPRQGVPPPIETWEQFAEDLRWGSSAGSFGPGAWWWELRPHRRFGTLEFRVPDGQSSVSDGAAVAAVIQALVAWLAQRHQAGEQLPVPAEWRIAENRWSACRDGVEGRMAGLRSAEMRPTRDRLHELIDGLEGVAGELGCTRELTLARGLAERNGAMRQRQVAADDGLEGLGRWLADRFLDPWEG